MTVNTCVVGGAHEPPRSLDYVGMLAPGNTEVCYVDDVLVLPRADQKIFWFYVSTDDLFRVDVLEASNKLVGNH